MQYFFTECHVKIKHILYISYAYANLLKLRCHAEEMFVQKKFMKIQDINITWWNWSNSTHLKH